MKFLCIGEPLVELTSPRDMPSRFDRRAGGDMLNTAIYLARLTAPGSVGYLSRLGDDPMSVFLHDIMAEEGIIDLCITERGGRAGLSLITTDAQGERSFTYWRDQFPARRLFIDPKELGAVEEAGTLILSGVTLAMLLRPGRTALLEALAVRHETGKATVFDTNYRPVLWPDIQTARETIGRAATLSSLILPSQDDMAACFGTSTAEASVAYLTGLGSAEIVLTTGGGDVLHKDVGALQWDRHVLPPPRPAVDTTGAGDSFNAGWLAARAAGASPQDAITAAARLSAEVVVHPGAILPRSAMPTWKIQ